MKSAKKRKPAAAKKRGARPKPDVAELKGLVDVLRKEVAALEASHPRVVDTVNEISLILSRLGI